jgi:hypothetical protein
MKSRLGAVAGALLILMAGTLSAAAPADGLSQRAPWCTNTDLKAGYRYSDSGAGHVWGWIVLRNRSEHACRTGGFGGISYVGNGDGTQVGAAADRTGTPATYLLGPGQRVRSLLQETRAANYPSSRCRPRHVDGFRVYVPDATRSQYVAHPTTGCRNPNVHLLTHKPYRRP